MKRFPKFEERINSSISNAKIQQSKTRYGTILSYSKMANTALVLLDERMTNQIGDVLNNVPCPAIQGVQMVSPTPGTRCVIGFTDENERYPYIISYSDDSLKVGKYFPNYHVNTRRT